MDSGVVKLISIPFADRRWDLYSDATDILMAIGEQHHNGSVCLIEKNPLLNLTS